MRVENMVSSKGNTIPNQFIINGGYDIDDDIEALMMSDFKCSIVKSSPDNIKITFVEDIEVIKKLL